MFRNVMLERCHDRSVKAVDLAIALKVTCKCCQMFYEPESSKCHKERRDKLGSASF